MIRLALVILVTLLALTLAGLALGERGSRADFVVASEELRTIDPRRVSYADEIQVAGALFEGLTRLNPITLEPEPGVADQWEFDASRRVVTFHLRSEARWSDGTPVTADDFRRGWLSALTPASGAQYANLLIAIDGAAAYFRTLGDSDATHHPPPESVAITAIDDRTLRVGLHAPCPYLLDLVAMPIFAPQHPAGDGATERIGNGAFTLERWDFKRRLLLRRNQHYWDAANIHPRTIELFMTGDPNLALSAYESGRIDLVRTILPEPARLLAAQRASGRRTDFHTGERFATFFLRVNCTRPPLDDPVVRRALSLAVDKDAICRSVLSLGETPADTYVPPGAIPLMRRADPSGSTVEYQPPRGLGADLTPQQRATLARNLLSTDGRIERLRARPLELAFSADPPIQAVVCQAIQEMWQRELGIEVSALRLERKVLSERIRKLECDLVRSDWYGDYFDPMTFLEMYTSGNGQNRTGWANAEYDGLIAAAAADADDRRRFATLAQAERLLTESEVPIIPIYFRRGSILLRDGFTNLADNPREIMPIHRVIPPPKR